MSLLLIATVLVPLAFALLARLARSASGTLATAGAIVALAPALALLVAASAGEAVDANVVWLPAAELEVGLRLDGLSATMSVLVALAGVAALVHSRGYFADSPRAPLAEGALLAFLAAMQGLVLAGNLLTLLVFWELVGVLSARLIAFERDDERAAPGAVRAFLTTRSADAGLYIAIAALFAGSASLGFDAARPDGALGVAVGLGLVLAAAGKSAQLPFQTWLSGAMAGPTPVSALLHSATMVAAGVYLLVRAQDLLAGWPLELAGWLGAITAVAAAAFALAQRDLKQVLASSTASQLGLMFVAAGAAAPAVAIFQLVAHATGKAGMFLSAGVFQRHRGATSLERLRGVGREEPAAFWGFAVSAASIAAVPPLAAFFSKDAVLAAAESEAAWFALAVLASAGTAAYLLRPALVLRSPTERAGGVPNGLGSMLAAIGLLVAGSLTLGAVHTPLAELLGEPIPSPAPLTLAASLAALAAGAGLLLAHPNVRPRLVSIAERQLFTDAGLRAFVQTPVLALASAADRLDQGIDATVDRIARGTLSLAGGNDVVERRGIDAAVDGVGRLVARGAGELPRLQSGLLYRYLRNTVVGIAALAALLAIVAIS